MKRSPRRPNNSGIKALTHKCLSARGRPRDLGLGEAQPPWLVLLTPTLMSRTFSSVKTAVLKQSYHVLSKVNNRSISITGFLEKWRP